MQYVSCVLLLISFMQKDQTFIFFSLLPFAFFADLIFIYRSMKRIWNAIGKTTKDTHFRANAVKQFEKIESGSVKVTFINV